MKTECNALLIFDHLLIYFDIKKNNSAYREKSKTKKERAILIFKDYIWKNSESDSESIQVKIF